MKFGDKGRQLRLKKSWTLRDLAAEVGVGFECNRSPDPMARRPARVLSRRICGLRRNVLFTVVAGNSAGSVPKDRLQGRCEDPKSLEPPRSSNASHFAPGAPSPDAGTPLQLPLSQSEVPVLSTRRNAFAADDVPGS